MPIRSRTPGSSIVSLLVAMAGFGAIGVHTYVKYQQDIYKLDVRYIAWSDLSNRLNAEVDAFNGEVGLVVEDLVTGWRYEYRGDVQFPAASTLKVQIMMALYRESASKRVDLNSRLIMHASDKVGGSGILKSKANGTEIAIGDLVELMITQSDNTATNLLIDHLGYDLINQFLNDFGSTGTLLARKMMEFDQRKRGIENFTTANDLAMILGALYKRQVVNKSYDDKAIALLLKQHYNDRIPRDLPKDTPVAHKTGLERNVCHDVGIVFTPEGDYAISVFTKHRGSSTPSKILIGTLSRYVYDYMIITGD